MREIINTFEQFCKKLDKNIIVEERILNDVKGFYNVAVVPIVKAIARV